MTSFRLASALRKPGDFGEGFAEFWVVGFYAVIEVDFEALLGQGEKDIAFIDFDVFDGFEGLFQSLAVGGGSFASSVELFQLVAAVG